MIGLLVAGSALGVVADLRAQELPAGHPDIGAMGGRATSLPRAMTLTLLDVSEHGVQRPAVGVTVRLTATQPAERPGMKESVVESLARTTDAAGRVSFGPGSANVTRTLRIGEGTSAYELPAPAGGEQVIRRYARVLGRDALEMDIEAMLDANDSGLQVETRIVLRTSQRGEARFTEASPLPLPWIAPAVGALVVDGGVAAETSKHTSGEVDGPGRVIRREGRFAYIGVVGPDRSATIRLTYQAAFDSRPVRLGLRSTVGSTRLSVVVAAPIPASPRISAEQAGRHVAREQSGQRVAGFIVGAPLGVGESAFVTVSDLPDSSTLLRRTLAMSALGLCALAALLFARVRASGDAVSDPPQA